jgi:hypothetical protein
MSSHPSDTPPLGPVRLWRSPLLSAVAGVTHGVSERHGGVSVAPFVSLNLGLHVGDDLVAVRENRCRLADAAGSTLDRMVCAAQVHGARVAVVTAADSGRGANDAADAIPAADALVTDAPDLLLTLFFADCLPILLADPRRRVVAVAHAGWRGLVDGVIENTVAAMAERFGTRPEDLVARIGPGIGPECFEVGPEVAAQFDAAFVLPGSGDRRYVDLKSAASARLRAAGVPGHHVDVCPDCTACATDRYFSHRRENGHTGRIAAFVRIVP